MWGSSFLLATLLALPGTLAGGTNDQVEPDIDYGSFQSPSSNVRPRFRYWVNDAALNLSIVSDDIKAIGKAGAGGIELLGYYLYGDRLGDSDAAPLQTDWTINGFGGENWSSFAPFPYGLAFFC